MNTLLLTFTYPPVPDNIAGRFAYVIAALRWILFRFPNRVPAELSCLVSNRIGRLGNRFAALYASWQAGTLRPSRPRATPRKPCLPASRPLDCLPRKAGWLGDLLSEAGRKDAWVLAVQVRSAVENDPEMQAFLAAAPQAGRILRPLLQMLSPHQLPEALHLPKPPRSGKPPRAPKPQAISPPVLGSRSEPRLGEGPTPAVFPSTSPFQTPSREAREERARRTASAIGRLFLR